MPREMVMTWELLDAITRARQQLAAARPMIWERCHMPTAEHTAILRVVTDGAHWRPAADGDRFLIRVWIEVVMPDARHMSSCLDFVVAPDTFSIRPYISLVDGREHLLWDGAPEVRHDTQGLLELVDFAARNLLRATMRVDFRDPLRNDVGQMISMLR